MHKYNVKHAIDNRTKFDFNKKNFAETYFILINDPRQNITMVVRYVLFNGETADKKLAETWVWFRDAAANTEFAVRQKNPLSVAHLAKDKFLLEIGPSGISHGKAWGKIVTKKDTICWDFALHEEGAIGIDRFPGIIKYTNAPQFYSPFCKNKLSGFIRLNNREYKLNNVNASDGHYWGAKKDMSWNWGNCVNFIEDPDFLFEGISLVANPKLPPSMWMFFHWEGKIYNCCGLLSSMLRNHEIKSEENSWRFSAQKDGIIFNGSMSANPADMIMHSHPLPGGKFLYTTISLNANLVIDIYKKNKSGNQKIKTLTAQNTASFEITKSYRNPQVTREYQMVEMER